MTSSFATRMALEIDEIPEALARLASQDARSKSKTLGATLRQLNPNLVATIARGSSDHAATYLSYVVQTVLHLPVASIGPSIHSVYGHALKMDGVAAIAISQSGGSEDISTLCQSLSASGAHVVALTNAPESPLAMAARDVIDILAGPEHAVAATKSFFNSIVAGLWLIADWAEEEALVQALQKLPDCIQAERKEPLQEDVVEALSATQRTMTIARGAGLGLAHEFALKLMETCAIHASAYSAAEVLHGPSAILHDGFPVVALSHDRAKGLEQALVRLAGQGARVATLRPRTTVGHPLVDPLLCVDQFYRIIEAISCQRGMDPDSPPHLSKVTRTL